MVLPMFTHVITCRRAWCASRHQETLTEGKPCSKGLHGTITWHAPSLQHARWCSRHLDDEGSGSLATGLMSGPDQQRP